MTIPEFSIDYSTHRNLLKVKAEALPWPEGEFSAGGLRLSGHGKADNDQFPLVTIITVVRNNAGQVAEAIESVLSQSYNHIEFIVADGASTDGTVEVLRKYDHCIDLWYSRPDGGIYNAMNTALDLANGRYVHFLNSDDNYPHRRVIEIVMDEFMKSHPRWIHGNVIMLDKTKGRGWIRYSNVSKYYYLFKGMPQQAFIFEKELYQEYGKFNLEYSIAADQDFLLRIMMKAGITGKYLNIPVVVFDTHGISGNMKNKQPEVDRIKAEYFPKWALVFLSNPLFKKLLANNEIRSRKRSLFEKILKLVSFHS